MPNDNGNGFSPTFQPEALPACEVIIKLKDARSLKIFVISLVEQPLRLPCPYINI